MGTSLISKVITLHSVRKQVMSKDQSSGEHSNVLIQKLAVTHSNLKNHIKLQKSPVLRRAPPTHLSITVDNLTLARSRFKQATGDFSIRKNLMYNM